MATESLLNSRNPIALFDRVFQAKEVEPLIQRQRDIQAELAARERALIVSAQCDREGSIPSL